jgi:V8-like Glu-specific endopeptidase
MAGDRDRNEVTGSGPERRQADHDNAAADEEEYWTAERRAAARPVPAPVPSQEELAEQAERAAAAPPEAGPSGHLPPGQGANGSGHASAGPAEGDQRLTLSAGGNPVATPLAYPYATCGKLFFTQGGSDFAGSAAMITPNVLLTAGHCVFGAGQWSQNVAFYPSYPSRGSSDPAYKFSYSYVAAWTGYTQSGNRAFDYGMVWFDTAPGQLVGWLGLLWNASTSGRSWDAVGYPATPNPPFAGQTMDEAPGMFASSTTSGVIGLTNDNMEHGSSGGPWITDFNGSPREYANGLQSFHVNDGDFTEYGPYFTADVKGLLDWISNPANRHS